MSPQTVVSISRTILEDVLNGHVRTHKLSYLRLKELAGLERSAEPLLVTVDGRKKEVFRHSKGDVIIIQDLLRVDGRAVLKVVAGRLLTLVKPQMNTAHLVQSLLGQDRENRFATTFGTETTEGVRVGIFERVGSAMDVLA